MKSSRFLKRYLVALVIAVLVLPASAVLSGCAVSAGTITGVPVIVSRAAQASDLPDLVIDSIKASNDHPSYGDIVKLSVTFSNNGSTMAHTSYIGYYIDGQQQLTQDISTVQPGQTKTAVFNWIATYGTHEFTFVLDVNNQVPESNENNNTGNYSITTLKPDLTFGKVSWTPALPNAGTTVAVSVEVTNNGSGNVDSSFFYPYANDKQLDAVTVPPLKAGATITANFSYTVPPGPLDFRLVLDPSNLIQESDETNNTKSFSLPVALPDLTVGSITWTPASPNVNDQVTFTVVINNIGRVSSPATQYYYYVGGYTSGAESVPSIAPGDSYSSDFTWSAVPNTGNVTVNVDPLSKIAESDETNNSLTKSLQVRVPDLVVESLTWSPLKPSPGEATTITATVHNQGDGDASPCQLDFLIDGKVAVSKTLPRINSNGSASANYTWTAEAGSHVFSAIADSRNQVIESNENNNQKTVNFPIPADLVVNLLQWQPKFITAGESVNFTVGVMNQGQSAAPDFLVGINMDSEYVGYITFKGLAPGASENGTYTWKAQAGLHTISAIADQQNLIVESNKTNNDKSASFTVSAAQQTSAPPVAANQTENKTSGTEQTVSPPAGGNKTLPAAGSSTNSSMIFIMLGVIGLLVLGFIVFTFTRNMR